MCIRDRYNSSGQEISVLYNDYISRGDYNFEFAGKNLPSGVYFCRALTEKYTSSIKMILLK